MQQQKLILHNLKGKKQELKGTFDLIVGRKGNSFLEFFERSILRSRFLWHNYELHDMSAIYKARAITSN